MRLWSIHPRHLDGKGLVAVWREALLGQAVLRGRTRGYTRHPQLQRFRSRPGPLEALNVYLWHLLQEATARGYRFDVRKVRRPARVRRIPVGEGQIAHERKHLLAKLKKRAPAWHRTQKSGPFSLHPLFRPVPGGRESWERGR